MPNIITNRYAPFNVEQLEAAEALDEKVRAAAILALVEDKRMHAFVYAMIEQITALREEQPQISEDGLFNAMRQVAAHSESVLQEKTKVRRNLVKRFRDKWKDIWSLGPAMRFSSPEEYTKEYERPLQSLKADE